MSFILNNFFIFVNFIKPSLRSLNLFNIFAILMPLFYYFFVRPPIAVIILFNFIHFPLYPFSFLLKLWHAYYGRMLLLLQLLILHSFISFYSFVENNKNFYLFFYYSIFFWLVSWIWSNNIFVTFVPYADKEGQWVRNRSKTFSIRNKLCTKIFNLY